MSDARDSNPSRVNWTPSGLEPVDEMSGRSVSVARFRPERDAADFFAALCGPAEAALWRYIPFDAFPSPQNVAEFFEFVSTHDTWTPYVFRRPEDRTLIGTASHMRVRPDAGSAEIGFVMFSPAMQRTTAATEAMYLLARHVLETCGYRRYEWKCDNDNKASKRAAQRLGFVFEGVFRQDMVVSGRNRDTAWFSLLDREWPQAKRAFETWLDVANFAADGSQKRSLNDIRLAG